MRNFELELDLKNKNQNLTNCDFNILTSDGNNLHKLKNSNTQYLSNSYWTTKTDENSENKCQTKNMLGHNYKSMSIGNLNSNSLDLEDNLFEEFKNIGIIDEDLDTKINEYKSNLTTSTNNSYSLKENSNLSLKLEFQLLKNSLEGAQSQLCNLQSIETIKQKKIEILEDALNKIRNKKTIEENGKKSLMTDSILKSNETSKSIVSNTFKRNNKINSVNTSNKNEVLQSNDHNSNANNIDTKLSNLKVLKYELNQIKQSQTDEINSIKEKLFLTLQNELRKEKKAFEEKLEEINSDNRFLINSLQNEIDFIKNKTKVKLESLINIQTHEEEIEKQNLSFCELRSNYIKKLNLYESHLAEINNCKNSEMIAIKDVKQDIHTNDFKCYLNTKSTSSNLKFSNFNIPVKVTKRNLNNNNHLRSHSHSTNSLKKKKNSTTSLTNVEYNIIYNTNQDIYKTDSTRETTNMNINTHQMNYSPDKQINSYLQNIKASKRKISFEPKLNQQSEQNSNINMQTIDKYNKNNIQKKLTINPEDYLSNSTVVEVNLIRNFNPKFLKK